MKTEDNARLAPWDDFDENPFERRTLTPGRSGVVFRASPMPKTSRAGPVERLIPEADNGYRPQHELMIGSWIGGCLQDELNNREFDRMSKYRGRLNALHTNAGDQTRDSIRHATSAVAAQIRGATGGSALWLPELKFTHNHQETKLIEKLLKDSELKEYVKNFGTLADFADLAVQQPHEVRNLLPMRKGEDVEELMKGVSAGKIDYEKLSIRQKLVLFVHTSSPYYRYTHPNTDANLLVRSRTAQTDILGLSASDREAVSVLNHGSAHLRRNLHGIGRDPTSDTTKAIGNILSGILTGKIQVHLVETKTSFFDVDIPDEVLIERYQDDLARQLLSLVQFVTQFSRNIFTTDDERGILGRDLIGLNSTNVEERRNSAMSITRWIRRANNVTFHVAHFRANMLTHMSHKGSEDIVGNVDLNGYYFDPKKAGGSIETQLIEVPFSKVSTRARSLGKMDIEEHQENRRWRKPSNIPAHDIPKIIG